ncbi:MAG TPA: DUF4349 domain-containing protein [Solirubrobacteraceae bacterium]|nr:DUF4349 domain-containing protein [Solirubrobacteraceae bacterium]
MRRLDDTPIDPEIAAELDAIDATLAGEPVDPQYADIAELALLLVAERPAVDPEFGAAMDARVRRRFTVTKEATAAASPRRVHRIWPWWPQLAALSGGVAAAVVLGVALGSGGSRTSGVSAPGLRSSSSAATTASSAAVAPVTPAPAQGERALPSTSAGSATSSAGTAFGSVPGSPSAGSQAGTASPAPAPNGRKIIQSAQLALSTAPNRVGDVAQEVFNVVGRENGIVRRSSVTATGGTDGYAQFELSVPSAALQTTMASLSRLPYAHVASRTDSTQDVNGTYVSIQHRLADDRALRTALLKQLASATTQQQIDSLTARIHDAEASIAGDLATLRSLNRQIDYSQISVSINAAQTPVTHGAGTGGFSLGKAAHDAGRVLTIGAGVALIALAVLVPVGLVAALVWWIGSAVRRRRREHALDIA